MSMEYVIPPRGVSKSCVYQMMSRVRQAIKDFDPSYKFKKRGWICAKEWREICPPPLDYIWGPGYTNMAKRLPEDKIPVLKAAAKATITIDGWSSDFISLHPKTLLHGSVDNIDWDLVNPSITRYMMRDPIWGKGVSS